MRRFLLSMPVSIVANFATIFAISLSTVSNASPMGNVANYNRTCHSVIADPNRYIADWGAAMASVSFTPTVNDACIFNSFWQGRYWNTDGTPKTAGYANGVDFSIHAPGTTSSDFTTVSSIGISGNPVYRGTSNSRHQSEVSFLNQTVGTSNLLMPVLKVAASSELGERNSTNASAWTGFERIAGTGSLDLQLVIDFDYFNSDSTHRAALVGTSGVSPVTDYHFNLSFLSTRSVTAPAPGQVFPEFTDIIAQTFYSQDWDDSLANYTASSPFRGQLILDLGSLLVGDAVYVAGNAQAFGFNGGFTDAYNTVSTRLQVVGLSDEESKDILESEFIFSAPSVANVPEPMTLTLILSGLFVLGAFRRSR